MSISNSISNPPNFNAIDLQTALTTVFSPPRSSTESPPGTLQHTKTAHSYLEAFQRSPLAWGVALTNLTDPNSQQGSSNNQQGSSNNQQATNNQQASNANRTFFCAQTLKIKCAVDTHQIGQPDTNVSAEQVKAGLLHALTATSCPPVLSQLSSALAALSINLSWSTVISDILLLPHASSLKCLLITGIAEEFAHGGGEWRQATSWQSLSVLGFLSTCAGEGVGVQLVMKTALDWVAYVDSPPSVILQSPNLVNGVFESARLSRYDESVDLIIEVMRRFPPSNQENADLVQAWTGKVMELVPVFNACRAGGDVDGVRSCVRIFTDMGESYCDLLMDPRELGQKALVGLVLECARVEEAEVACITMNFWYLFVASLERLEPYERRQDRIDYFAELVTDLVNVCCRLLVVEEGVEEDGDFEEEAPNGTPDWREIEACLFAIKSVSNYIPRDESAVIPHVMNLLQTMTSSQSNPKPIMRQTMNILIGRYGQWLSLHPTYLSDFFNFLIAGLKLPPTSSSSALAIKSLCESASSAMCGPVLSLYEQVLGVHESLNIKDEAMLLEGVCKIMCKMTYAEAASTLSRIMQPIGKQLEEASNNQDASPKQVNGVLSRLTVVVSHVKIPAGGGPNLVLSLMQQCWPMLTKVVERFGTDPVVAENVCRCYKHSMRNCKEEFTPLLEPVMQQLVAAFDYSFRSSYLYAASICITEFSNNPTYSPRLFEMIVSLSTSVFKRFVNIEAFTSNPDVVEEFFYLLSRFIKYCPNSLFQGGDFLGQALKCAVVGLQVHHREANKGVLNFFETTFQFGLDNQIGQLERQGLERAITMSGEDIVKGSCHALMGETPLFYVDAGSGSLAGVLYKLMSLCPAQVALWANKAVRGVGASLGPYKDDFENQIIGLLSKPLGKRGDFNRSVRAFNDEVWRARRRAGV
ncbi:hypothetical protein TrRE_jg13068 [Triparma retinervis]|uniref:Exportin-1/Importin-beta-like domain-containing protein n=1 Tax=Triparma retinervis TaxID=2557542 RepID=A0A9W7G8H4_9STRA|nr:hypothetical protein TrRE_jg13068 [Triparma retinervis]